MNSILCTGWRVRRTATYQLTVLIITKYPGLSEPKKGQEDEAPSLKSLISSHKREALMANPSLRASETSASSVTSQKEQEGKHCLI